MRGLIFFLALAIVAFLIVIDVINEKKATKRKQDIFRKGAKLVFYVCKNEDFDDYEEIGKCTILDTKGESVKLEWSDGHTTYDSLRQLGVYDDKLEVYHDDKLVAVYKFE